MKRLLIILLVAALAIGTDDGDYVDPSKLPLEHLASGFYAGYLSVAGGSKKFYYVYLPSQNNPSKDPLMVEISSGPGCSSALYNWLYQKGPFIFMKNDTKFRINPNNLNKYTNLLFIQGPAGVGFSEGSDINQTDDSVSFDYYQAILSFYDKFTQLKDQDLYFNSQQYGGIIVPKLSLKIYQHNKDPLTPSWSRINLKGFILNNPCTVGGECQSSQDFNNFTIKFLSNRYFINSTIFSSYVFFCQVVQIQQICDSIKKAIQKSFLETGADIRNVYKPCVEQVGNYPCLDHQGIDAFFNQQTIREAMHVKTDKIWQLCNTTILKEYIRDPQGSFYIYQQMLRQQHNLRIWIVSGTMSGEVPTLGTRKWIDELRISRSLASRRLWAPWTFMNQTINAGQIQQFSGITYLTIRSAGYFIYQDQPEISYHMFDTFMKGNIL